MSKSKFYPILNIFFFLLCIYVNFLSVTGGLGGKSIRELSDQFANLFTPSNQTFGIWSLIYLLLTITLLAQFIEKWAKSVLHSPLFLVSCILNGLWIVVWQFELIGLSLAVMIGLLITLARINMELKDEKSGVAKITFGVYIGWICIATIANATTFLQSLQIGLSLPVQEIITISIICTGVMITLWVMYKLNNPFLFIAVSWALYGIHTKRAADHPLIAQIAMAFSVLIIVAGILLIILDIRRRQRSLSTNG